MMAVSDAGFNVVQFEKRLSTLKDSQESINSLSAWCLENRQHHKKIVAAWLNVLKRAKVDHRLTLFYLANDVIQYSKRKNYEFVESWGTSLQKATTLVREENVKHRILRIFKIWEQRGIYGEEFLADLSGLISVAPVKKFDQDSTEFQPSYLISKIQQCTKLEEDTDVKLKKVKDNEQSMQWQDPETILTSLKDRQQVEDVEKEVEHSVKLAEVVTNALNTEIKARKHLLNLLTQAEVFYRTQKGEVKVVANAYKSFGSRVKNLKKRLDEMLQDNSRWASPIPSPDVNAPSPGPDSDIELPGETTTNSIYSLDQTYSANFYNPISSLDQSQSFQNNGFSSFIGQNMPFDIHANLFNDSNTPSHVSDTNSTNNLIEVVGGNQQSQQEGFNINNIIKQLMPSSNQRSSDMNTGMNPNSHLPYGDSGSAITTPLQPPPMPPFTSPTTTYAATNNTIAYSDPVYPPTTDSYSHGETNTSTFPSILPTYNNPPPVQVPYHPVGADEYNPEEEPETWENDGVWPEPPDMETPESPPGYEKEGLLDPIEYHDVTSNNHPLLASQDVDHRVLLPPPHLPPHLADIKGPDTDHRTGRSGSKDIDHRNLISLTGSPRHEKSPPSLIPPPPLPPNLWANQTDQDYRSIHTNIAPPRIKEPEFQRSSLNSMVNLAQLASDPPPPPPPVLTSPISKHNNKILTPRKSSDSQQNRDNVESIDMDLSDDESIFTSNKQIPLKDDVIHLNNNRNNVLNRIPETTDRLKDNVLIPNNKRQNYESSPIEEKQKKTLNKNQTISTVVGSSQIVEKLEPPPMPPLTDTQDDDVTANNLLENIESQLNEENFLQSLAQENEINSNSTPYPTPPTPEANSLEEQHRRWYNNEWNERFPQNFQNIPPDFQARPEFTGPLNFLRPPVFPGTPEFPGPPDFHRVRRGMRGVGGFHDFVNRGRGGVPPPRGQIRPDMWVNRGVNRGFPRMRASFRGRGMRGRF